MWPFDRHHSQSIKEKFQSRKYKMVWFWNVVALLSLALQGGLAATGSTIRLPLEFIIGIAGALSGAYIGVNLLDKFWAQPTATPSTDPSATPDPVIPTTTPAVPVTSSRTPAIKKS